MYVNESTAFIWGGTFELGENGIGVTRAEYERVHPVAYETKSGWFITFPDENNPNEYNIVEVIFATVIHICP